MSYLKQAKEIKIQRVDVATWKEKRSEWNFGPVEIPRLDGQGIDIWMVGTRTDKPGAFQFWFVENRVGVTATQ